MPTDQATELGKVLLALGKNATRLLDDAALLSENDRGASAYVLAILALEEVGEILLKMWGDDEKIASTFRGIPRHIKKQTAAACLITAKYMWDGVTEHLTERGLSEISDLGEGELEALMQRLAQDVNGTDAALLMTSAPMGILDLSKQAGLYTDLFEVGINLSHEDFTQGQDAEAIGIVKRAFVCLADTRLIRLAYGVLLADPVVTRIQFARSRKR
jgi:AbiV family abortive infection protein